VVSTKAIRTALYSALNVSAVTSLLPSGSAGLVHGVAPPTALYPICLFQEQASTSTLRMGGNAFDSDLWVVKGISKATSASLAEDIDNAVRTLLDFGTLSITGGTLMHMARESGVSYAETSGEIQYRHHGSLYRVVVQT